ncbi:MAG: T9SS type A sorting domain-containing protein [Saprospiraceae bacterium]
MNVNNYTIKNFKHLPSILVLLFIVATNMTSNIHAQSNWNDPGASILINGNQPYYHSSLLEIDGKPAIAFCDVNANFVIKYQRATDTKGATWGSAITVDNGSFSGAYGMDMAIINGNPAIANSAHNLFDIRYTRASNTAGDFWNSTVVVASNVSSSAIEHIDLQEVNGKPAIAYYDSDDKDLYYVRAADANGTTWNTPVLVASTGDVGKHLSLSIINGRPAISYYDETNGDLMYVRANDTGGSSWGTPMTVFSSGDVGLHTSLETVNGRPAIIFSDFTNKRLIYIRASNANGSAWGSPVVAATHYGEETEMLIIDGQPAIAYYTGFGDQDLRYLRSQDNNGTSWGTYEVLDDGSAAMGNQLSMAVIDGNPAISYQDFTNSDLKYIRADNPNGLPVELTFFKGQKVAQGAELTWQTATEKNNEGFDIQRSDDGKNWETIDFIQGYGTTQETKNYTYFDKLTLTNTNYYRLMQIDFDGQFEYSHVISVSLQNQSAQPEIRLFPNPVSNQLNIEGGQGLATIYNILGQPIREFSIVDSLFSIETTDLPNGQYMLTIQRTDGKMETRRFVK